MPRLPGAQLHHLSRTFELEFGGTLEGVQVEFETWGALSDDQDNVVFLCPAFSANSHARSHLEDPSPGWWEKIIGPGLAIDTDRWFVVCPSLLGSCHGSTGPLSISPRTGRQYAIDFPVVTTRDIVDLHAILLNYLGIKKVDAIIGGSFGAMQVVEFLVRHPDRARRAFCVSGTMRTRPYTAAIRHIGRHAITSDPKFKGGRYGDDPPSAGLILARELGTLFYRSREEFNDRFDWAPKKTPALLETIFDVQSYLEHQGLKAVGRFDPNSYLLMSLAMDLHDIARGFDDEFEAMRKVRADVTCVGVKEDRLIPIDEQMATHRALLRAGCSSTWRSIQSNIGHDAFLVETASMTELIGSFLS